MNQKFTLNGEAFAASSEGTLAVEQFLKNHYLFRFNELSGKVEFVILPAGDRPV